jgi:hypothetical protein
MKTILLTLLITTTASVMASTQWKDTPFWSAPVSKNFLMTLSTDSEEFQEECKKQRKRYFNQDGSMKRRISTELYIFNNTLPLPSAPFHIQDFYIDFQISDNSEDWFSLEKEVSSRGSRRNKKALPLYTVNKAYSGILLGETFNFSINITKSNFALSSVTQKLGINKTNVELVGNKKGIYLRIHGKDLACDLSSKHVRLRAQSPSYVRIKQNDFNKLEQFYHYKVAPIIKETLERKIKDRKKAAILGYRLGALIDSEFNSSLEETQNILLELFNTLFKASSLKPTQHLIVDDEYYSIVIDSSIDTGNATIEFVSEVE